MFHNHNNHEGNGNPTRDGTERQADPQPPGEAIAGLDMARLVSDLPDLRAEMVALQAVVSEQAKIISEMITQVKAAGGVIENLCSTVERVMLPMAEQNRDLRLMEVDEKFFRPIMNGLAQIVDRISGEITQAEKEAFPLAFIENCRDLDRQEILNLMSTFDVESYSSRPGSPLEPKLHSVKALRGTQFSSKVGHVVRTVRPGYRRRGDDFLIRRALVEVWVLKPSAFE
jgi:hypothetical protein